MALVMVAEDVSFGVTFRGVKTTIVARSDDFIARSLRLGAFYEAVLFETLLDSGAPSGTYVDVGAHIGNHTVAFAELFPSDQVIAIEPDEENFGYLRRNTERYPDVLCVGAAVHDSLSEGYIVDPSGRGNSGRKYLTAHSKDDRSAAVAVLTLDHLLHDCVPVLIKIDVEGGELAVLRSAEHTLRRSQPVVVVEVKQGIEQVGVFMEQFGYRYKGPFCATPTYIFRVPA